MKVQELILALEQVEKMTPGLDVGVYDTEFMVANAIHSIKVQEEIYHDYEKDPAHQETKKLIAIIYG